MKHMYIVDMDGSSLRDKVDQWISENEEDILEMVDIEYTQEGTIYFAIVTYIEREKE